MKHATNDDLMRYYGATSIRVGRDGMVQIRIPRVDWWITLLNRDAYSIDEAGGLVVDRPAGREGRAMMVPLDRRMESQEIDGVSLVTTAPFMRIAMDCEDPARVPGLSR